jgi:hypothetical protein
MINRKYEESQNGHRIGQRQTLRVAGGAQPAPRRGDTRERHRKAPQPFPGEPGPGRRSRAVLERLRLGGGGDPGLLSGSMSVVLLVNPGAVFVTARIR